MRSLLKKGILVLVFLIVVSLSSYFLLLNMISPDFDMRDKPNLVINGDTFNTTNGYTIKLADISTPGISEPGFDQAKEYLESLILDENVFLDIDDIHRWDTTGERLVCVLYISFNSTHYLNVNKALLVRDYAVVLDQENEFNPSNWNQYTRKFSEDTRNNLILVSVLIGVLSTIIIVLAVRRGYLFIQLQLDKVKRWIQRLKNRNKAKKEITDVDTFNL